MDTVLPHPLLPDVQRVFAEYPHLPVPWPPYHDEQGPVADEAYSRVTAPERYRLLMRRADAWLEVIEAAGLGAVRAEDLATWRRDAGLPVSSARRVVPHRAGAVPFVVVGEDLDFPDNLVRITLVDPPATLAMYPECGCDACDEGSQAWLDQIDEQFVHLLGGGLLLVRGTRRGRWGRRGNADDEVILQFNGWSGTGRAEQLLADHGAGRTDDLLVVEGEPWIRT